MQNGQLFMCRTDDFTVLKAMSLRSKLSKKTSTYSC